MAYPVDTVVTEPAVNASSFEVPIPPYVEGDLVVIVVTQDGGNPAFTNPSAPWQTLSVLGAGGAKHLVAYAVAGAAPLDLPVIVSSISQRFNAVAVTIRDADPVTPIDAYTTAFTTDAVAVSPTLTTLSDDCLMLGCISEDSAPRHQFEFNQLNVLGATAGVATTLVGYRVAGPAGPAPIVSEIRRNINDSTIFTYVAIKNAQNGALPPEIVSPPKRLALYGCGIDPAITGLSGVVGGALVDGLAVFDHTSTTNLVSAQDWNIYLRIAAANTTLVGWYGGYHDIDETDVSAGVLTHKIINESSYSSFMGALGYLIFLIDINGNWAAYKIAAKNGLALDAPYTVAYDFKSAPTIAESVAPIDLTRINRIGFAYHRIASATISRAVTISLPLFWKKTGGLVAAGGSEKAPVSVYAVGKLLDAAGYPGLVSTQGLGQALTAVPITIGHASKPSYIRAATGGATEFKSTGGNYKLGENFADLNIALHSSDDVLDLRYSATSSDLENGFNIVGEPSPSAIYRFSSAVFGGLKVKWDQSVACSGASFFGCTGIFSDGAQFNSCVFADAKSIVALETSNPGNVIDCAFTQGPLGGHAIEITQPGAFAFVGNTFDGYGLDGTTYAAIYNNSGGHVTLNVSGGGDTPTVRNGVGATTEAVSGAQVTVVGLATGSQVKVTKVSNGDVLFNGAESGGQISFSTTYIGAVRVDARKASASPFFKPWATQATTISGQAVEVTALQELDE